MSPEKRQISQISTCFIWKVCLNSKKLNSCYQRKPSVLLQNRRKFFIRNKDETEGISKKPYGFVMQNNCAETKLKKRK